MKSVLEFKISKPGVYELVLFPTRRDSGEEMRNQHEVPSQGVWDCIGEACPFCNVKLEQTHLFYGEIGDNEHQLRRIHINSKLYRKLWSRSLLPERRHGKVVPYDSKGWVAVQVTFKNGDCEVEPSSLQPSQKTYQSWEQSCFINGDLTAFTSKDLANSSSDFKLTLARGCRDLDILNTLSEDINPRVRAACLSNRLFKNYSQLMRDQDPLVRERCATDVSVTEVLEFLSNDPIPKVRACVASNPSISKALMDKFKLDPDHEVVAGLAWNKELTQDLIEYFCFHPDQRLRANISMSSEKISDAILSKMISDSSLDVLKGIIDRQPVSDENMKLLATSKFPEIRCLIAESARCESTLEPLYEDQDPRVFYFLSLNPNVDSNKLASINPKPDTGELATKILNYNKFDPRGHYFPTRLIISGLFSK